MNMKVTKMQGQQQNSTDDLSLAQLYFSTAVSNTDDSTNVQLQPPSPASSNIPPRRHLMFHDIKTLARLMGRLNKEEKEVILRLLDMASSKGKKNQAREHTEVEVIPHKDSELAPAIGTTNIEDSNDESKNM